MALLCILLALFSEFAPLAAKSSGVNQDPRVLMAQVGQTVTLKCFCGEDSVTFFFWYQQRLGGKPVIVSSRMRHNVEVSVSPSFKGRFEVESREGMNHLTISDLLPSDSAVYYCGILEFNLLQFGEGTFLHVRTPLLNVRAVAYQPGLSSVPPGDSLELSCEVRGEKCKGEQSFYWFKQTTAQPVILHPIEGKCVNEARGKKCTLTYSIHSANSSDEGVYYCALASCGKIKFGNGIQVQLTTKGSNAQALLVYGFSAMLAVSIAVLFALAFTAGTMKNQLCSVCKGTVAHQSPSACDPTDAGDVRYAAVELKKSSKHDSAEDENQCQESFCVGEGGVNLRVKVSIRGNTVFAEVEHRKDGL